MDEEGGADGRLQEIRQKCAAMTSSNTYKEELARLRQIEHRWQTQWEQDKRFEARAPAGYRRGEPRKKFTVTFPFPYMNGRLHLGHLFTVSKSEFAAGWHRMNGYNTLFPFAFHVTGQPICGAAKRLEGELERYGCPPVVPAQAEPSGAVAADKDHGELNIGEFRSRRTKAGQKASDKLQYDILREMGVPEGRIREFVDPQAWVRFFPGLCQQDMREFGARVDWRRSFVTTDVNPAFDAFVRWQFGLLRERGYVSFGKRNVIWSPLDSQPCMDHDRSVGEGVQVEEYTIVLAELPRDCPRNEAVYARLGGEALSIYLGCATLRPETMCGQTNVWVEPEEEYLLVRINSGQCLVTGAHAACNMAYQGYNNGRPVGQVDEICRLRGAELLNCLVCAPMAPYDRIPVLPLLTISMTKGTGVVTCVPSDAPDDYIALRDIRNNLNGITTRYGIDLTQLKDMVAIIEIPGLGLGSAARLCEEEHVKDEYDSEKLKQIKEMCYTKGYYEGVMAVGEFKGMKVYECKPLCRDYLVKEGKALIYGEPEKPVVARSGCECVVAQTEQYFIDYADAEWKAVTHRAIDGVNFYSEEVKNQFNAVVDWLRQWALSRTFGLGTRLPWDEEYLIESLSDSTIYNAYYTIADVLENGDLYGNKSGIPLELVNDDFFNYVFDLTDKVPSGFAERGLSKQIEGLREEFEYFYPVDLRCSGKDLVTNHLAFYIFNHCAVWRDRPEYWPRGIRSNGHLMLNGAKMSKSTGNFLTAIEAITRYSADGVRYALADAGDGNDDANFMEECAAGAVGKLHQLYEEQEQLLKLVVEGRDGALETRDLVFQAQFYDCAARCNKAFERCLFREGFIILQNDMLKARDLYVRTCEAAGKRVNGQLCRAFVLLHCQLLAVICPHMAEEIHQKLLGAAESVFTCYLDQSELEQHQRQTNRHLNTYEQIVSVVARLKMRYNDVTKPRKDGTVPARPQSGVVYVATEFSEWQRGILEWLRGEYERCGGSLPKSVVGDARAHALERLGVEARETKKVVKFTTDAVALSRTEGANAFVEQMPFDEEEVYREYSHLICQGLQLQAVEVRRADGAMAAAQPGRPAIVFDTE